MSKSKRNAPIDITFKFTHNRDGSVTIGYIGDDPRTYAVGDHVIEAIALANDFVVDEVFKGDVLA
jgi:hypothetical protein